MMKGIFCGRKGTWGTGGERYTDGGNGKADTDADRVWSVEKDTDASKWTSGRRTWDMIWSRTPTRVSDEADG